VRCGSMYVSRYVRISVGMEEGWDGTDEGGQEG